MYGKIFNQIYKGSLAMVGPWEALVTFQQFIILADAEGVVDMPAQAISRETTIPLKIINKGIAALQAPDPESRSPDEEGRRILLLSENRSWGWRIVNYEHYMKIRNAEQRREYHRQYWHKRKLNPDEQVKIAARRKTRVAIKSGRLEKGPCAECGSVVDIECHHEDYEKPLDVIWLCKKHHEKQHHGPVHNSPQQSSTQSTESTESTDIDIPLPLDELKPLSKAALLDESRLLELKSIYPKRTGSQPWKRALKAIKARMKNGATWEEIEDGICRYAEFCKTEGKTGTEFVMMASTFCGPDEHYKQLWEGSPDEAAKEAEEKHTEDIWHLAGVLKINRPDGQSWEAFEARVTKANERRLAQL